MKFLHETLQAHTKICSSPRYQHRPSACLIPGPHTCQLSQFVVCQANYKPVPTHPKVRGKYKLQLPPAVSAQAHRPLEPQSPLQCLTLRPSLHFTHPRPPQLAPRTHKIYDPQSYTTETLVCSSCLYRRRRPFTLSLISVAGSNLLTPVHPVAVSPFKTHGPSNY